MAQIEARPNGNYTHYLSAVVTSVNAGAGTATVHYRYWIERNTSAANGSFLLTGGKLFGISVNGIYRGATLTYDWRQYASRTMLEGDITLTGLTGSRTVPFVVSFEGHSASFPAASASGSLLIPWVPPAPTSLGIDQVTGTSFRYRFSGNGNGGSPIIRWEAQIATNLAMTQNAQIVTSTGTTTFTGRTPGAGYYVRSRGVTAIGVGPWSSISSVVLPAGSKVKDGGVQLSAVPWVKVAGVQKRARAWIKSGGVWK